MLPKKLHTHGKIIILSFQATTSAWLTLTAAPGWCAPPWWSAPPPPCTRHRRAAAGAAPPGRPPTPSPPSSSSTTPGRGPTTSWWPSRRGSSPSVASSRWPPAGSPHRPRPRRRRRREGETEGRTIRWQVRARELPELWNMKNALQEIVARRKNLEKIKQWNKSSCPLNLQESYGTTLQKTRKTDNLWLCIKKNSVVHVLKRLTHSGKQERDPFTDLRRGQSIFDKSMNHDVHSFCLFTPI